MNTKTAKQVAEEDIEIPNETDQDRTKGWHEMYDFPQLPNRWLVVRTWPKLVVPKFSGPGSPPPYWDEWNHAAIRFDGPSGVWRNFVNGTLAGTVAYTNEDDILRKNGVDPADVDKFLIGIDANLAKIPPRRDFRSGRIHVGANHGNAGEFKGYLNDYRYYNGLCKYKESFTSPTQMAFGELR